MRSSSEKVTSVAAFLFASQIFIQPATTSMASVGTQADDFYHNKAQEYLMRPVCEISVLSKNIDHSVLAVAQEKFRQDMDEKYPGSGALGYIRMYSEFSEVVKDIFLYKGHDIFLCNRAMQIIKGDIAAKNGFLEEVEKDNKLNNFLNFFRDRRLEFPKVDFSYGLMAENELRESLKKVYQTHEEKLRTKIAGFAGEMVLGNVVESYESFIYLEDLIVSLHEDVKEVLDNWIYRQSQGKSVTAPVAAPGR